MPSCPLCCKTGYFVTNSHYWLPMFLVLPIRKAQYQFAVFIYILKIRLNTASITVNLSFFLDKTIISFIHFSTTMFLFLFFFFDFETGRGKEEGGEERETSIDFPYLGIKPTT